MPRVYIILVNYLGAKDTIACIESLFKLVYDDFHIIVVDNYSPDNSVNIIQDWAKGKIAVEEYNQDLEFLIKPFIQKPVQYHLFKEDDLRSQQKCLNQERLTIIQANSNRGFSAGNNIGVRYALAQKDADYYWLLNNDTLVTPASLGELVKCHQQYPEENKVGIVGGKLLYYNEPDIIQCLGGGTYNELIGFVRQVGDRLPEKLESSKSYEQLDYVSGACMLVRTEFIEKVGMLAEDYFLYYEELDWCARGRIKGWSISYTNKAVIYHKVGGTINAHRKYTQKSEIADYYSVRNKLLYASKYNGFLINATVRLGLIGAIANRIIRGQFRRTIMILKLSFAKY